MPSDLRDHRYLGDGVYASFDGFQIWLHVGDHRNPPVVAIEPAVFNALVAYAGRHWRRAEP
jgi:hypothetical protein